MALRYTRITEEQDQLRNILPKGEYAFVVKSIIEKKTKSGSYDMLEVELGALSEEGREVTIKDWIVLMEEMGWKLRHFAATCGILDRYDDEILEAKDFLGKNGVVKLSIAEYEKDGEMRKINRVADYVKPGKASPASQAAPNDFVDDDIPL
jgi:hypothetical protein